MNRRIFFQWAAPVMAAILLALQPPAQAQFPGPGGPGRGLAGMLNAIDPSRVDPTRSALAFLLRRDDVRSEIKLTAKEREQLDGAEQDQEQAQQKAIMEMIQKVRANIADLQSLSPEEQQARRQEMQTQALSTFQGLQENQEKKIATILTPAQMTRLHELDLRWRGPLALGDKKLAETFGLTAEENTAVDNALKEYRDAFSKAVPGIGAFMRRAAAGGAPANTPGGAPPNASGGAPGAPAAQTAPPTPEEMRKRQEDAQKELEKTRTTISAKVVKALTREHKQKWETAQGKPFQFRLIN